MYQYKILKYVIEKNKNTKTVVDIGTALDPHYFIKLAKDHPNIHFYATDVDISLLNKITGPKNLKKKGGDIMHLHYKSRFADVTSEFATMPLVSLTHGDVSPAIIHMNRITKPGGYVIFGDLTHKSLLIKNKHLKHAKKFAKEKNAAAIKKYFLVDTKQIFRLFGLKLLSVQAHIDKYGTASFICKKLRVIKPDVKVSFVDEGKMAGIYRIIKKM